MVWCVSYSSLEAVDETSTNLAVRGLIDHSSILDSYRTARSILQADSLL